MKRSFITACLISITLALSAQQKPSFIGLQAGPSFPVGKFQEKKLPDGSFTLIGFSTSLEGAWFFTSWMGVGGSAGMHFHPVDVRTLGYEKVVADPFMNDVYIRSDPYRSYTVYAGLFFQFPLVQRLSLTAKALRGIMFTQSPYQLYKADYEMIGEKWFEITSAGDFEGSFLAGAGLKYELKNCIGFSLNTEFTYNEMNFDFELSDGSVRTDKKVVAFVNVLLGIFIKI
ncbi:MAG: hypothetical protein M0Q51_08260 [Bacteroidales bacterium]|nr:hypothetical protein [Bacteroidales bacterium]